MVISSGKDISSPCASRRVLNQNGGPIPALSIHGLPPCCWALRKDPRTTVVFGRESRLDHAALRPLHDLEIARGEGAATRSVAAAHEKHFAGELEMTRRGARRHERWIPAVELPAAAVLLIAALDKRSRRIQDQPRLGPVLLLEVGRGRVVPPAWKVLPWT